MSKTVTVSRPKGGESMSEGTITLHLSEEDSKRAKAILVQYQQAIERANSLADELTQVLSRLKQVD